MRSMVEGLAGSPLMSNPSPHGRGEGYSNPISLVTCPILRPGRASFFP